MNYGKLEGICFASIMGQMPDGRLDRPGPVGALDKAPEADDLAGCFSKHTTLQRNRHELPLCFPQHGFRAAVGPPAVCRENAAAEAPGEVGKVMPSATAY